MSIRMSWANPNGTVDEFRVYRALSPIAADALPTPLAILSATTLEYTDTTNLINTAYHYRIGAVVDGNEALGENKAFAEYPYTGPGPQTLVVGDWESGFFGRMTSAELFSFEDMVAGLGAAIYKTILEHDHVWLKFVHRGKICFITEKFPAFINVSYHGWDRIFYEKGLAYGTDDAGPARPAGTDAVIQDARFTRDGHTYRVRLPDIYETPYLSQDSFADTQARQTSVKKSFLVEAYSRLYVNTPFSLPNWESNAQDPVWSLTQSSRTEVLVSNPHGVDAAGNLIRIGIWKHGYTDMSSSQTPDGDINNKVWWPLLELEL